MKKGFTLIELLAVIVILAVIALIAIPQITNVVENTRVQSLKSSAEGLVDAAYLYGVQNEISNSVRFDINDNVQTSESGSKLKYKGNIKKGSLIINNKGEISVCVTDGTNSAYKNFTDKNVSLVTNKVCNIINELVYFDGVSKSNIKVDKTVSSVAGLKAASVTVGQKVKTNGYYKANDGGSAYYIIEDKDSIASIKLDNGLYARILTTDKVVNVKQFGAKGDGEANDTTSIKNAFKALQLDDIDTVVFPGGKYIVNNIVRMYSGNYVGTDNAEIYIPDKNADKEYVFYTTNEKGVTTSVNIDNLNFVINSSKAIKHIYTLRFYNTVNSKITNTNIRTEDENSAGVTFIDLYSNNNNFTISGCKSHLTTTRETEGMSTHIVVREFYEGVTTSDIKVYNFDGYKNGKDESVWVDAWNGNVGNVEVANSNFYDAGVTADTIFIGAKYSTSNAYNISFHDNTITKEKYSYKIISLATVEKDSYFDGVSGLNKNLDVSNNTIEIKSLLSSGLASGTGVIQIGNADNPASEINDQNSDITVSNNTIKSQVPIGSVIIEYSGKYQAKAINNKIYVDSYNTDSKYFNGVYSGLAEVSGNNTKIAKYDETTPVSVNYLFRNVKTISDVNITNKKGVFISDYLSPVAEEIKNSTFTTSEVNSSSTAILVLSKSTVKHKPITITNSTINQGKNNLVSAWYSDINKATVSDAEYYVNVKYDSKTKTSNLNKSGSISLTKVD